MRESEYKIVACTIKKDPHLARYGLSALDPYILSLNYLVERFCFEIGDDPDGGLIIAEKRDPVLDHGLELAWLDLRIRGTEYVSAKTIETRVESLLLRDKKSNIAGLQLADLVVSPIGRAIIGRPAKEDRTIVKEKLRQRDGNYRDEGLVVLPEK